jgi:hypothetical protein
LPFTPVNLCFALFDCDNGLTLLGDGERLAPVIGQTINIAPLAKLASLLTPLAGKRLLVEPASLKSTGQRDCRK